MTSRTSAEQDFNADFAAAFDAEFNRLFRYLDRLSGDPDLASDLVQEAFIRLHRRGSMPGNIARPAPERRRCPGAPQRGGARAAPRNRRSTRR